MSKKHTPGPWAISRDAVPAGWVQNTICAEGSGERVATAFLVEENARLIAAAPDLLAAVIAVHGLIESRMLGNPDQLLTQDAKKILSTAIARAKGG